ncbi:MAG: glycosyltransferase [Nitrospira sp.]|nr:glycosyltransferase [Nitrospira sp.]
MFKNDGSSSKCRILYLVGQLGMGGLERQLVWLLENPASRLYMPMVMVWNFQSSNDYFQRIRDLGVEVLTFPAGFGALRKLAAFCQIVKRLSPEVIHSFSFYTNFPAYLGGVLTQAVSIGALRSDFVTEKDDAGLLLGPLCARWPHVHISNNMMAVENVKQTHSFFTPQKLYVVRNGMDLNTFKSTTLSTDPIPKILSVGSLLPVKRWDRLLSAVADLKDNGYRFLLRIAGEGPLRTLLGQQSMDLGLAGDVEFLGQRHDIPDLLAESMFLVHTSDREGSPNVVTEAMACGRAVVATDVGDIPFLIDEGKTGFIVRRGDSESLSNRMGILLQDRELCRQMGEAGRAKAEREFGSGRLFSETFAVYRAAGWKGDT